MQRVGLGIVTYNRPEFFKRVIEGVVKHLLPVVDYIVIYNDGSDSEKMREYRAIYRKLPRSIDIVNGAHNRGVAFAKNFCLTRMMDEQCDYLLLGEDDVIPTSPRAVTGYIELSNRTELKHFNFAHHGTANPKPEKLEGEVAYYPNCIGAWSFYTKKVIETVGLMDENFHNAWEHVEHTARIARAGLTSPFWLFADHIDSKQFLKEIPESIGNSTIRKDPHWNQKMIDGLEYWRRKDGIGIPPR